MTETLAQFKRDLAEVPWKDLRIHLQRGAIIIVDPSLELLDVAVAVAEDHTLQVTDWIAAGKLLKPSLQQIEAWETQLDKPFRMLIAQPYILVQAVAHA